MTTTEPNTWDAAYRQTRAEIILHPQFRKLIREVAVAEQNTEPPSWRRRRENSPTGWYWATRGNIGTGRGRLDRRALLLAGKVAFGLDLDDRFGSPSDALAVVYVTARDFVRTRRISVDCPVCHGTGGRGWIGDVHSGMPWKPCRLCWPRLNGTFLALTPPEIETRYPGFFGTTRDDEARAAVARQLP